MTVTTPTARKSLAKIKDSVSYYPHQIEGIRDLARRGSFLLADEMGLGKTLQAYTVAAIDFERNWAKRVLVVCPASLKGNWDDERKQFTNFSGIVLQGTKSEREKQLQEFAVMDWEVLIVNYEQVVIHLEQLNTLHFDIVIFDEAHYLKSYKSARTKACIKLNPDRRFLLTGSPLLNQVNEFWPLLHIIDPVTYPGYWKFVNRYAVFGGFQNKQIVGVKNKAELTTNVSNIMLRRLKKNVLDLPDKQFIVVKVDFHDQQKKVYEQARDEMQIELPTTPMDIENALVKFLRLKQICGTPAAIDSALADNSYKLDRAVEIVKEIVTPDGDYEGEPVVIFTQFRGVLACIVKRLQAIGVPTFQLHGDVPIPDRQAVVRDWSMSKTNAQPGALCAMIQVAGVGLNMTAASKCIFLDKLFVPKLNEQAQDRLHRIGADTTQPVQIFELLVRGSIEARIEAILRRKRKLFDQLIEDNNWKKMLVEAALSDEED
jgi:SNF2 family DNA or RNA helicase